MADCGGSGKVEIYTPASAYDSMEYPTTEERSCPGCEHPGCPARSQGQSASENNEPLENRALELVAQIINPKTCLIQLHIKFFEVAAAALKAEYERGLAVGQSDRAAAVEAARREEGQ